MRGDVLEAGTAALEGLLDLMAVSIKEVVAIATVSAHPLRVRHVGLGRFTLQHAAVDGHCVRLLRKVRWEKVRGNSGSPRPLTRLPEKN